jgi:hypothetical protein
MSCSGLHASLPVCLGGSEEPRWQHVYVKERRADGTIKMSTKRPGQELVLHYVQNLQTGELFLYEEGNEFPHIQIKCVLIAISSPFYTMAVMLARVVQTLFQIAQIAEQIFCNFGQQYEKDGLGMALWNSVCTFGSEVYDKAGPLFLGVITSPLYWAKLEFGACVGVFFPLEGREIIADTQEEWFSADFRADNRYISHRARLEGRQVGGRELCGSICFLAWCFLPRGNINDQIGDEGQRQPRFIPQRNEPIY